MHPGPKHSHSSARIAASTSGVMSASFTQDTRSVFSVSGTTCFPRRHGCSQGIVQFGTKAGPSCSRHGRTKLPFGGNSRWDEEYSSWFGGRT